MTVMIPESFKMKLAQQIGVNTVNARETRDILS